MPRNYGQVNDSNDVLFIADLARILRVSRDTIDRRLKAGSFPIPELPRIDSRHRWSVDAVERYLDGRGWIVSRRRQRLSREAGEGGKD